MAERKIIMDDFYKAIGGTEYRTLQAIANDLGVTRERVRQILKERALTHIPSRRKPDRRKTCPHCSKKVEIKTGDKPRTYCSESCKYNQIYTFVDNCAWCSEPVILSKKDPRIRRNISGLFYCNHHCFGKYASRHYGFAKDQNLEERKENFLICYATKVHDYRSIQEASDESGIHRSTVDNWRNTDILFKKKFDELRSKKK